MCVFWSRGCSPRREVAVAMSRLLNRAILVRVGRDGRPSAFRWPAQRWRGVAEVLEEWVYRAPWWDAALREQDPAQAEDTVFFRVLTGDGAVVELAASPGGWRLYREFD
jgi:hypothetical protein